MVNRTVFRTPNAQSRAEGWDEALLSPQHPRNAALPTATTKNLAHAPAYKMRDEHALAQLAVTGCFNGTFYSNPASQLKEAKQLAEGVDPTMLAKIAVYAREQGYMKDMPAFLLALLSVRSPELCKQVFNRVVDDVKMLRNFVQIVRSGEVGRKSLGYLPRKLVRDWFASHSDEQLFRQSVGKNPSIADVIRLAHIKPHTESRAELQKYLLGHASDEKKLPQLVQHYERFKRGEAKEVPDVPFQMLDGLPIEKSFWRNVALKASWHTTRMNLNTFKRHGVLDDPAMVELIANRLSSAEEIQRTRIFPYQLLSAYLATEDMPHAITEALQDAMELATTNVPRFPGQVVVCPDVSGSMSSSITGERKGATSKVRCIDVATLVASTVLRSNPTAEVIPFEGRVVPLNLNSRDSIMTNARQLAGVGGGSTNCAAPLQKLLQEGKAPDVVIFVSDYESWICANRLGEATPFTIAWHELKRRNPSAKLVCIDVTPNTTSQAPDSQSVLNIGGFSDNVFEVIRNFTTGEHESVHWLDVIERVQL